MAKEKEQAPGERLAQLEQENAALQDRLQNIEKLLAMQQPVTAPIAAQMKREEEFERKKAELSMTCQERTQLEARRRWQEPTEYKVKVADVPEISIPARSREEAKGRYDELCGILSVDTEKWKYEITPPSVAA